MKTYWLLGHDPSSDHRRPLSRGIALPPPLFSIRESESWRRSSPKNEFPRRQIHKQAMTDSDVPLVNGLVGGKGRFLKPPRSHTKDASQSNPWEGNEMGWNAAYEGSNPDSLENPDEGFDGRSRSTSRNSSNNSRMTGKEPETSSLTAVDENTRPLICSDSKRVEFRKFGHKDSWKRPWSADAIDSSKVSLKDWFTNVFSNNTNGKWPATALQTVSENDKEESTV